MSFNKEEFDHLYWQVELIHQAIDFSKLRQYSYLRLQNSMKDVYYDLTLDLDDEKDGIYKKVKISIENCSTSIQQCKNLDNGYLIFEYVEFFYEEEIHISKILLKTNYPENEKFIPLYQKTWSYNSHEKSFEELISIDYTTYNCSSLENVKEKIDKEVYRKCLSRKNKK